MTFLDKLFSFEGRLRRRDYWLLGILLGFIQVAVTFTAMALAGADYMSVGMPGATHVWSPTVLVLVLVQLAFLWPFMALTVKRRHDRDAPGLPFVAIQLALMALRFLPFNLLGIGASASAPLNLALGVIQLGVGLWFLIVLGFLDGTPGSNSYGPSPKATALVEGVFD